MRGGMANLCLCLGDEAVLRESLQENSGGSRSCFRPHLQRLQYSLVRIVQSPPLLRPNYWPYLALPATAVGALERDFEFPRPQNGSG